MDNLQNEIRKSNHQEKFRFLKMLNKLFGHKIILITALSILLITFSAATYYIKKHQSTNISTKNYSEITSDQKDLSGDGFYRFSDTFNPAGKILFSKEIGSVESSDRIYPKIGIFSVGLDGKDEKQILEVGGAGYYPAGFILVPGQNTLLVNFERALYRFDLVNQKVKQIYSDNVKLTMSGAMKLSPSGNLLALDYTTEGSTTSTVGTINLAAPNGIKEVVSDSLKRDESSVNVDGWMDEKTLVVSAGHFPCPSEIYQINVDSKEAGKTDINTACSDFRFSNSMDHVAITAVGRQNGNGQYSFGTNYESGDEYNNSVILRDNVGTTVIEIDNQYRYELVGWSSDVQSVLFTKERMAKDAEQNSTAVPGTKKLYKYGLQSKTLTEVTDLAAEIGIWSLRFPWPRYPQFFNGKVYFDADITVDIAGDFLGIVPAPTLATGEILNTVSDESAQAREVCQQIYSAEKFSADKLEPGDNFCSVGKIDGDYATGGTQGVDGGGANWIATKLEGKWVEVGTTQDLWSCTTLKKYNFPKGFIGNEACWNPDTQKEENYQ